MSERISACSNARINYGENDEDSGDDEDAEYVGDYEADEDDESIF
jgi:hypothetical protein